MPAASSSALRSPRSSTIPSTLHDWAMGSMPRMEDERDRLVVIGGTVPPPFALPAGCRFNPALPLRRGGVPLGLPAARRPRAGSHGRLLEGPRGRPDDAAPRTRGRAQALPGASGPDPAPAGRCRAGGRRRVAAHRRRRNPGGGGESGCGKSTLARLALRLIERAAAQSASTAATSPVTERRHCGPCAGRCR